MHRLMKKSCILGHPSEHVCALSYHGVHSGVYAGVCEKVRVDAR